MSGDAMDPEFQALGVQLADATVRNTASAIADRIGVAKARRKDQETIAELEEIVSGLLSDKSELVRIAQAYEEALVAQRISQSDIEYLSNNFVPILTQLMETAAAEQGEDVASIQRMIDLVKPILSVETVTILQLIGFNFKKAIGEPLTELVAKLISSRVHPDVDRSQEIQALSIKREVAYLEVARDAEAHARLQSMLGHAS
jgi:hypothetical protein